MDVGNGLFAGVFCFDIAVAMCSIPFFFNILGLRELSVRMCGPLASWLDLIQAHSRQPHREPVYAHEASNRIVGRFTAIQLILTHYGRALGAVPSRVAATKIILVALHMAAKRRTLIAVGPRVAKSMREWLGRSITDFDLISQLRRRVAILVVFHSIIRP